MVFNESLYCETDINHSMINQNQIRKYGIYLWENPSDVSRNIDIDIYGQNKIPLRTNGTKIQFTTRVLTEEELCWCDKRYITITE